MSICQRKDGRFVVKFKDEAGRWRQKGFRDREAAEAFEGENLYDNSENKRLTVAESILLFLSRTKHVRQTEQYYALILSRMDDTLAGKYVDTLTRKDLEHFRDQLRQEWQVSAYSTNRYVGKLIAAWRWCASEDFLDVVPWAKYRPVPEPPRGHWCGSFDDFRKVYILCSPALQWAIRTCLALCLRPGKELFNLNWGDVDLTHGKASVWMPKPRRQKTVYCPVWWLEEARGRAEGRAAEDPVCPSPRGKRYVRIRNTCGSCQTPPLHRPPHGCVSHAGSRSRHRSRRCAAGAQGRDYDRRILHSRCSGSSGTRSAGHPRTSIIIWCRMVQIFNITY